MLCASFKRAAFLLEHSLAPSPSPLFNTLLRLALLDRPRTHQPANFGVNIPDPWAWCDFSTPWIAFFCPTPNPIFNVLMKAMVPGAIRPVLDLLESNLMDGKQTPRMLFEMLIPPMDGFGALGGLAPSMPEFPALPAMPEDPLAALKVRGK